MGKVQAQGCMPDLHVKQKSSHSREGSNFVFDKRKVTFMAFWILSRPYKNVPLRDRLKHQRRVLTALPVSS